MLHPEEEPEGGGRGSQVSEIQVRGDLFNVQQQQPNGIQKAVTVMRSEASCSGSGSAERTHI